ncbi:unnamed protein product [Schistocephalus solidus]|uniref:palmitoyl-protein hydrolase n=1 Tax=Schistocephalus solidus TaxID=70667 RepID=A0A183S7W9_SCHSO|nr:unnamed protein product [Schistocephalus solidus]
MRLLPLNDSGFFRYDIYGMSPDAPQDEAGIRLATIEVAKLVQAEIEGGIPEHRIIVGGFSQGGGLALYYGLTSGSKLGGIVALSSWLPLTSTDLPILQCHGLSDRLVPSVIGDLTHRFLLDFQMSKCSLQKFAGLGHGYNDEVSLSYPTYSFDLVGAKGGSGFSL